MDTQRLLQTVLTRYRWAVNLAFIAIGAFFIAKTINVFVYRQLRELPSLDAPGAANKRPPANPAMLGPVLTPSGSVQAVLGRNIMQARRELPATPDEAPKRTDPNERKPCSIGNNILGIIAANTMAGSFVVYRDPKTQETRTYAPVEGKNKIGADLELLEVYPAEAKFRREDHIEVCVLGDDGKGGVVETTAASTTPPAEDASAAGEGVTKVSENEYAIEQKKLQWVQEHLNEVATDARIVPAFKDGKAEGFKLFSIRPGSVYQQIGLQNGDVIKKINGFDMTSPDKALEIYGKLRDARSISVELERRGAPKSFNYQIR